MTERNRAHEKTNRDRVLDLLRAQKGRFVRASLICDPGIGGSEGLRRVRELRDMGYVIDVQKPEGREERAYRLVSEPATPKPLPRRRIVRGPDKVGSSEIDSVATYARELEAELRTLPDGTGSGPPPSGSCRALAPSQLAIGQRVALARQTGKLTALHLLLSEVAGVAAADTPEQLSEALLGLASVAVGWRAVVHKRAEATNASE